MNDDKADEREEQNGKLARCKMSRKKVQQGIKYAVHFHGGGGELNDVEKLED